MQKAPAESALNVEGRIHNGMNAPTSTTKMMMVSRRPMYCESQPAIVPPLDRAISRAQNTASKQATHAIAPQLPMIVATVESCALKPFVVCRYVGYRSCEPCERKLNPVMSTTG